jgi:hypothetical protein
MPRPKGTCCRTRARLSALAAVLVAAHRAGARFAPVQCPPDGHKRPVPTDSSPHRVPIAQIRHQGRPKRGRPNAEPSQVPTERAELTEVAAWAAPLVRCAHLTGSAGSRRSSGQDESRSGQYGPAPGAQATAMEAHATVSCEATPGFRAKPAWLAVGRRSKSGTRRPRPLPASAFHSQARQDALTSP